MCETWDYNLSCGHGPVLRTLQRCSNVINGTTCVDGLLKLPTLTIDNRICADCELLVEEEYLEELRRERVERRKEEEDEDKIGSRVK